MTKTIENKFGGQAEVFKALAHPTRLFIVNELAKNELCVKEITELVGVDISTISKHLSILKQARIVSIDKRGNCVYYRLKMTCVLGFFTCVRSVLEN